MEKTLSQSLKCLCHLTLWVAGSTGLVPASRESGCVPEDVEPGTTSLRPLSGGTGFGGQAEQRDGVGGVDGTRAR